MTKAVLVVDASVALKWVITEPGSDDANRLLDESTRGSVVLVAPEHMLGEVGNGLRKRVARGLLEAGAAIDALVAITELDLHLLAGAERWVHSLTNALRWGVTTYDALYIAAAIDVGGELVTADGRLVTAARPLGLPVRALVERVVGLREPRSPID